MSKLYLHKFELDIISRSPERLGKGLDKLMDFFVEGVEGIALDAHFADHSITELSEDEILERELESYLEDNDE